MSQTHSLMPWQNTRGFTSQAGPQSLRYHTHCSHSFWALLWFMRRSHKTVLQQWLSHTEGFQPWRGEPLLGHRGFWPGGPDAEWRWYSPDPPKLMLACDLWQKRDTELKRRNKATGIQCGEISPTRCNNCVFYSQWLYSTCFGWQSHPSSGVQCCIWPQVSWLT